MHSHLLTLPPLPPLWRPQMLFPTQCLMCFTKAIQSTLLLSKARAENGSAAPAGPPILVLFRFTGADQAAIGLCAQHVWQEEGMLELGGGMKRPNGALSAIVPMGQYVDTPRVLLLVCTGLVAERVLMGKHALLARSSLGLLLQLYRPRKLQLPWYVLFYFTCKLFLIFSSLGSA